MLQSFLWVLSDLQVWGWTVKTYAGKRINGQGVLVMICDGQRPINPLEHIERHSPDGFEFGYHGSGPADLALSILTDVLGGDKRQATIFYQKFKEQFVGKWRGDSFEIEESTIIAWLNLQWRNLARDTGAVIPPRFAEGV